MEGLQSRLHEALRLSDAAYRAAALSPLRLGPQHYASDCAVDCAVASSVATLADMSRGMEHLRQRVLALEMGGRPDYPRLRGDGHAALVPHTAAGRGLAEDVRWVRRLIDEALDPLRDALRHQERLVMDVIATVNAVAEWGSQRHREAPRIPAPSQPRSVSPAAANSPDVDDALLRRIARLKSLAQSIRVDDVLAAHGTGRTPQDDPSSSSGPRTTPSGSSGGSGGSGGSAGTMTTPSSMTTTTTGSGYSGDRPTMAFRRLLDLASSSGEEALDANTSVIDAVRGIVRQAPAGSEEPSAILAPEDTSGVLPGRSVHFADTTGTTMRMTSLMPLHGDADHTVLNTTGPVLGTDSLDVSGAAADTSTGTTYAAAYAQLLEHLHARPAEAGYRD